CRSARDWQSVARKRAAAEALLLDAKATPPTGLGVACRRGIAGRGACRQLVRVARATGRRAHLRHRHRRAAHADARRRLARHDGYRYAAIGIVLGKIETAGTGKG